MNELEAKIRLFEILVAKCGGPVDADQIARDVVKTLELFEGRLDVQPEGIGDTE